MRDTTHLFRDCSCEFFTHPHLFHFPAPICAHTNTFLSADSQSRIIDRAKLSYSEKFIACSAGLYDFGNNLTGDEVLAQTAGCKHINSG